MIDDHYQRVASFRGVDGFRARLRELGLDLPCDDAPLAAPGSPLAQPLSLGVMRGTERIVANRFAIQPMEGWDGGVDGRPSPLTVRRWRNFGRSGAAWIWGGEAMAVSADGRANPHQLVLTEDTAAAIGALRHALVESARDAGVSPVVGVQLTHSGRWAVPTSAGRAPRVAFRHPLLDARVGVVDDGALLSDVEVRGLIGAFARAAHVAQELGFDFVDLKHCHGYLLHEFLSARSRPGDYGGIVFEARTRLMRELLAAVQVAAPHLAIGVRLSVFDGIPHRADVEHHGVPEAHPLPYTYGFGIDADVPAQIDYTEPIAVVRLLAAAGVRLLNVTAGSPYYVPHLQRPAAFPPSDGYLPPEDPLMGVARMLQAARTIKAAVPEMVVVSSGWSYLQEYLPHVAQACVRAGWFDAVGLGRMALAYPELPRDVLSGSGLDRKRLCRTFSDCTTAPRNGFVSGCYPLDPFYRTRPEREQIEAIKRSRRQQ